MSYQYRILEPVLVKTRVGDLCRDFGRAPSLESALRVARDLELEPELVELEGEPGLQLLGKPRVSEREGLAGVVAALEATVLKYAEPGSYTVVDEYGRQARVVVA